MPRRRRVDQALRVRHRGVRRVTALILLIGIGVVVWAMYSPERRRGRAVGRLFVGSESAEVTRLLGQPGAVCAAAGVDHLRRSFPGEWPPVTVEAAVERMQAETAQRWVYPLDSDDPAECAMRSGTTEIGIGRDRRVLWYVPLTGRSTIVLPPDFTPAGAGEELETNDTLSLHGEPIYARLS